MERQLIYTRPETFKLFNFQAETNRSNERWTVDYQEDLDFVRQVYANFIGREASFTYSEMLGFLKQNPQAISGIEASRRNEQLHGE